MLLLAKYLRKSFIFRIFAVEIIHGIARMTFGIMDINNNRNEANIDKNQTKKDI